MGYTGLITAQICEFLFYYLLQQADTTGITTLFLHNIYSGWCLFNITGFFI